MTACLGIKYWEKKMIEISMLSFFCTGVFPRPSVWESPLACNCRIFSPRFTNCRLLRAFSGQYTLVYQFIYNYSQLLFSLIFLLTQVQDNSYLTMKKCRKADDCLKHKTCLKFSNEIITAPTIAQGKTVSELPRHGEESEGEIRDWWWLSSDINCHGEMHWIWN